MTARTSLDEPSDIRSECWCCGTIEDPDRMVHLGNHPEVRICIPCAYSIKNWAWEIEDRSRTGLPARSRDRLRRLRQEVIRRGWHRRKWIGGPVRWLGKRLP
jgi:hypothetical protein